VTLRISEHAGNTDVGRQRHTNEDSLLVSPPVFAVADGMGGAQAGEVASRLAVEAFEEEHGSELSPEERLTSIARDANRRIYELASQDESRRGMGTTLTAAVVSEDEVSIGHVGDSRAYRMRDGDLEQLTRDHSLVAELERSGQLTPEAAEHHPQRSIITRALGPEPDVDVDTYTVTPRSGDVYLLCSDGLTSMVSDEELGSIVRRAGTLEDAATELVRAANQSGGKDNVTVVLFRVEDDEAEDAPGGTLSGSETIAGEVTVADVEAEAARRDETRVAAAERAPPRAGRRARCPAVPRPPGMPAAK
jgi:serine/threonine protein phosphatase PrpC